MGPAANSNSALVGSALSNMIRRTKRILGCAISLTALAASAQITPLGGGLPLFFEANHGQVDHSAPFVSRGRDYQFLISPTRVQAVDSR